MPNRFGTDEVSKHTLFPINKKRIDFNSNVWLFYEHSVHEYRKGKYMKIYLTFAQGIVISLKKLLILMESKLEFIRLYKYFFCIYIIYYIHTFIINTSVVLVCICHCKLICYFQNISALWQRIYISYLNILLYLADMKCVWPQFYKIPRQDTRLNVI